MFLSSILAYVGLNPNTDINWVVIPAADEQARSLAEGKVDVVLAFPPAAQDLRAKKIGHVILNSMMDNPWSQYFCCMVAANPEFVQKNPVATKRALRAILKATDIAARERVNQILTSYKQRGYLTVDRNHRITVRDPDALARQYL
jgi:NitT/TauT family transport system substrate-binding protein